MSTPLDLAAVAALVGDPARANILCALLDGRAFTASELAYAARVSPQTTSGHLGKLAEAKLISPLQQGRFRYYRLASPLVGKMLESIMNVAALGPPRLRPMSKTVAQMRTARLCYDHCAGRLGVGLADALCAHRHVELDEDGGLVTPEGARFLETFGIDFEALRHQRRTFCKPCLDWSERRPHLAGALGAALARRLLALGWIERLRDTRALKITAPGERGLRSSFGLALQDQGGPEPLRAVS
ncbi:MAG TPA: helix-turn-helix transcriptional regulator [Woeseiaceae bacterium]|nr:helix-turn-helix transcriptional regulator [Woeseiaceae bacterium]